MLKILGWCIFLYVVVVVVVNALTMLVSPKAWFRMPMVAARGSLTKREYSTGWGAFQLRLTGALVLGVIGWTVYESYTGPHHEMPIISLLFRVGTVVALALSIVNGLVMLVSPRAWLRLPRWARAGGSFSQDRYSEDTGAVFIRVIGAVCLLATWFFWEAIRSW